MCIRVGLAVLKFMSGAGSLPSSIMREKSSSSPYDAGVDVVSDG